MSGRHARRPDEDAATPQPAQPAEPAQSRRRAAPPPTGAVLPGPPTGRLAAREDRRQRGRTARGVLAGLLTVAVLAGLGWVVIDRLRGSDDVAAAPGASRTQSTLVLQLVSGRSAVVSALLAHDGAGDGEGAVVLVPSSLVVDIPGFGSARFGDTPGLGNPGAASLALSQSTGVIVDGAWTLTPAGLAALVDRVDGVTVDVDREVLSARKGGGATVLVPAGPQQLDGALAAAYAGYLAAGEPEQKRLARFAEVVRQLIDAFPESADEMGTLVGGLGKESTTTVPLQRLGPFLAGLRADQELDRVTYQTLPTRPLDSGGTVTALVLDPEPAKALVANLLAGSLPKQREGGQVRVLVQNGVGTPGLGEGARTRLVDAGFTYVNGGNAASFGQSASVVLIKDAGAAARREGGDVATALGLPDTSLRIAAQGQSIADVVVILGADYKP